MTNRGTVKRGATAAASIRPLRIALAALLLSSVASDGTYAAIIGTTGTVVSTATPYPPPSDSQIFVFDELQGVAFVGTQPLDFGAIAPGTLVNSHYLQFDPASSTGFVGSGTVTFDGPIVGVITSTANLIANLSPDVIGTSDTYFGLETTLGPYPAGAPGTEQFRGLGSPLDNLTVTLGSNTLVITSFDVPTAGALDGVRILTLVPEPSLFWLLAAALGVANARRRRSSPGET